MLVLAATLAVAGQPTRSSAQGGAPAAAPLKERNLGVLRAKAAQLPRSENDQAIVDGWPLYRTERGQAAFNDAMAALKATDGPSPAEDAFKGCAALECNLKLPQIGTDGWMAQGRLWVSPNEYVLFVHSPRQRKGPTYRRHGRQGMRYFVYHEFHNGTRNVDTFDTISSHGGSVFVPLYMSKQGTDAQGRRYVMVVQVAPYDVVSTHDSSRGSAGPGMEVAKNVTDPLEPLQGLAGIVVGSIIKAAAPQLRIVNHRGSEGQPMLAAYERHLTALRNRGNAPEVALPFVAAPPQAIATAAANLEDLILRRGASPRIPMAERGIVPPRTPAAAASPPPAVAETAASPAVTLALSPLAAYLRTNLAAMKRHPDYARHIPEAVDAIAEESPEDGVVYLLDERRELLGRIEAYQGREGATRSRFAFAPIDREISDATPFELDFAKPVSLRSVAMFAAPLRTTAAPALIEPIRPALRPACAVGSDTPGSAANACR